MIEKAMILILIGQENWEKMLLKIPRGPKPLEYFDVVTRN